MATAFVVVYVSLWVMQIYLSTAQWWDSAGTDNGWVVIERPGGVSFWSAGGGQDPPGFNSQISKVISGKNGQGGYCADCGGTYPNGQKQPPCPSFCQGAASANGVDAGVSVPNGFGSFTGPNGTSKLIQTKDDCRVLCEQNQDKDDPDNSCSAWEFRPAVGQSDQNTCFLYVLSSYPPSVASDTADSTAVGYSSYGLRRDALVRQIAVSVFALAPMVLLAVAYHNYFYGSVNLGALSVAVPLAASIALFAFLGLVGFSDTAPPMPKTQCFGGQNQACFANATTGGLNSGVCYNKCCGATVSCLVKDAVEKTGQNVYATCTWPNVACKDGSCAATPEICGSDHGGMMDSSDYCESGGVTVHDGMDYNGDMSQSDYKVANPCYALRTIQTPGWNSKGQSFAGWADNSDPPFSATNFPGAVNKKVSSRVTQDTNQTSLQPGITPKGAWNQKLAGSKAPIVSFQMTRNMQTFLKDTQIDPKRPSWGCGLATNTVTQEDELFLNSNTPNYLTCNVVVE